MPESRQEGGGAVALDSGAPCKAGNLKWETNAPFLLCSSPAPVSQVRTCHLCLLEDPSVGCISGSEKCTIESSSPFMVITIYYGEFKTACLGYKKEADGSWKKGPGVQSQLG